MSTKCDQPIYSSISALLAVISIMSYINNQSLNEQLEKCRRKYLHCKRVQTLIAQNVFTDMNQLKLSLPKDKQIDLQKLEHYLISLAPSLSKHVSRDTGIPTYSCREEYKLVGWPHTEGFRFENCSRLSIYESTTLILMHPVDRDKRLTHTLENAFRQFRHVIIIHEGKASSTINRLKNKALVNQVDNILIPSRLGYSDGDALNHAIDLVKSPFVLVAPYVGRLEPNLRVERLIHVQERTNAALIGGAVKDIRTGEWSRSCSQVELKLYTLRYIEGYHLSQHECLFCDSIVSPFLARRDTIEKIRFSKLNHGVFEDLFLRLKSSGQQIMSCPDVMYYVEPQNETTNKLRHFAKLQNIRRIIKSDKSVLWFGFRAGIKQTKKIDFTILGKYKPNVTCGGYPSISISPDCRHNLLDVLLLIFDLCAQYKVYCGLEEGTLLGAVKFYHILPWERDADITFYSRDFEKILKLRKGIEERGFRFSVEEKSYLDEKGKPKGGIIYIKAYGWHIELFGSTYGMKTTTPLTKMKLGNRLVYVPENPGLYVRNRYGHEIFRHAEHWRAGKMAHSSAGYVTGKFPECIRSRDHSCLDQFHADGNLQFQDFL